MPKSMITDQEILQAALIGFQHSLASVDEKIKELRRQLGVRGSSNGSVPAAVAASDGSPRRKLSAAARRRIAAAQKKRWAAYRKSHEK
jgi:hypothetical protein